MAIRVSEGIERLAYFCLLIAKLHAFCRFTQNLSRQGHCTSSRGFKYNQYVCSRRPNRWARKPDIQYDAYSMESLNNELLHIKVLMSCILSL